MATKFVEGYRGYTLWTWEDDKKYHVDIEVRNENNCFLRNEEIFVGQNYKEALKYINSLYNDDSDKYVYIPETPKQFRTGR